MRRPKRFHPCRHNPHSLPVLILAAVCLILLICCFPFWFFVLALIAGAVIFACNH